MTDAPLRPAVLLDRDGVINVPTGVPHAYVTSWEGFRFLPGVAGAIAALNRAGYLVAVVTNQRGVARGALSPGELDGIHRRMVAELASAGARVDGVYACPHEGGCGCRKPETGLLERAAAELGIDRAACYMVGDSPGDVLAGRRFGARTVFIGDEAGGRACGADLSARDLAGAVRMILEEDKER